MLRFGWLRFGHSRQHSVYFCGRFARACDRFLFRLWYLLGGRRRRIHVAAERQKERRGSWAYRSETANPRDESATIHAWIDHGHFPRAAARGSDIEMTKQPNKSPEPTTMAVTPRAIEAVCE